MLLRNLKIFCWRSFRHISIPKCFTTFFILSKSFSIVKQASCFKHSAACLQIQQTETSSFILTSLLFAPLSGIFGQSFMRQSSFTITQICFLGHFINLNTTNLIRKVFSKLNIGVLKYYLFIKEVSIIWISVHWFPEQINGLVSIW